MFLVDLLDIGLRAGQPDGHALAEAEGRVVPAVGIDRPDRQAGPLRELGRDESRYQLGGYVRFLHEQALCHGRLPAAGQ